MSVKLLSAILGPEMAAPILLTPGKTRSFCRKNHVRKIPLRFFFGGGGSADFIFMGARIFLKNGRKKFHENLDIFHLSGVIRANRANHAIRANRKFE